MRILLAPSQVPSNYEKYWEKLQYPLLGSPKLDGIRGVVSADMFLMSRTWIQLPSYQAQELFTSVPYLDGELIEGCETDFDVYNRTQSHIMSENKPGDLSYHIFDYAHPDYHHLPFYERHLMAQRLIEGRNEPFKIVPHVPIENEEELLEYEQAQVTLGFEGIMLRTLNGRYKPGRATINEGIIYKLKRFLDAEGIVVGFIEREINTNEQLRDERGYAKRSSAKAGMRGAGTLGKFIVDFNGQEINVGPGTFKHSELQKIWDNRDAYLQRILKFRYFAHGIKDAPRHARATGWRDQIDL